MVIFFQVLPFLDSKHSMASTIFMLSACQRLQALVVVFKPLGLDNACKKLETVCLGASVCHGQGTRTHMLQDEIFINFLPTDELTTSAIMACEGPTLAYNYKNYSVKAGTFIIKSSLPSAQNMKVSAVFGSLSCKQLEGDAAEMSKNSGGLTMAGQHRRLWAGSVCKAWKSESVSVSVVSDSETQWTARLLVHGILQVRILE